MDILVKFVKRVKEECSGLENHFDSIEAVQKYFLNLDDVNGNDNFFFLIRKKRLDVLGSTKNILNDGDNIYFVFEQKIIAKAIFKHVDKITHKGKIHKSCTIDTEKFKNGYKVRNVLLLASPFPLEKLTKNPFKNQNSVYFIKEHDIVLKKELKKLFK